MVPMRPEVFALRTEISHIARKSSSLADGGTGCVLSRCRKRRLIQGEY